MNNGIFMKELLFGTAGIPISSKGPTEQGIADVKKLGLGAMELEFVRSINISREKAPLVKKAAEKIISRSDLQDYISEQVLNDILKSSLVITKLKEFLG